MIDQYLIDHLKENFKIVEQTKIKEKMKKRQIPRGVFPEYVHGSHAKKNWSLDEGIDYTTTGVVHKDITDLPEISPEAHKKNPTLSRYSKLFTFMKTKSECFNNYTKAIKKSPKEQKTALYNYTKGSNAINDEMIREHLKANPDGPTPHLKKREETKTNPDGTKWENWKEKAYGTEEKRKQTADLISKTITQTPAHKDLSVYKGISFDPRRHMNNDGTLHSPGFMSTSIAPGQAQVFAPRLHESGERVKGDDDLKNKTVHSHILKINIPKGFKGGAYINGHTHFPHEHEFLIDKGHTLKIDKSPTKFLAEHDEENNFKHIGHIWHADILPRDVK